MIVRLFDQAGAPERVGRQFIDNLAGAVVVEHMRGSARGLGRGRHRRHVRRDVRARSWATPDELERLRRAVMDYAVAEHGRAADGGRLVPVPAPAGAQRRG